MNTAHVDQVVNAVVYEGHILYPYRPSSLKNQRRFTFGRVYPRSFAEAEEGRERCRMTTECLVVAADRDGVPMLEVRVRFLHPIERQVLRATTRDDGTQAYRRVPNLVVAGEAYHSWQEIEEQTVELPTIAVCGDCSTRLDFSFGEDVSREEIRHADALVGAVDRRRERIAGTVELTLAKLEAGVFKVTIDVTNTTPLEGGIPEDEDELMLRTMASTHTILQIRSGRFLSMTDPPERFAAYAAGCTNDGTWPVLVGEAGQNDTMLSSPIILYDYPEVADQSKGDLFDATEIDELLSLRIMTLTDKEKDEMRSVDAFARRILQRTESMTADDLIAMHGTLREWREKIEQAPPATVDIGGKRARIGDRVRLRPLRRADAIDLSLVGRAAEIEAIERDFEGQIYLAVILDDDPGRDLGQMRQPGHRFFYTPDELELVEKVS